MDDINNKHFIQLFNMLEDFCFILDKNEKILSANMYAIDKSGYILDELIGMDISLLLKCLSSYHDEEVYQGISKSDLMGLSIKNNTVISVAVKKQSILWQGKQASLMICKDVSKTVNANNRFSKAFYDNPSIMAISEIETGKYIDINHTFFKKLGYTKEEVIGNSSRDLNLFAYLNERDAIIETMKNNGAVYNHEMQVVAKNGDTLNGLFSCDTIKIDNKKYLLTTMYDVTEIARSKKKIEESEENFRNLFNTIDDLLIILDKDGYIIFTNDATLNKLGYSDEKLIGMHITDLHPEQYRKEAKVIVENMIAGKTDSCPLPLLTKSNFMLPVETRIWQGTWNDQNVLFGLSKDLSRRQAALDKFQKLFDCNPSPILICDTEHLKIQQVNSAFIEFGFDEQNIVGHKFCEIIHPSQDDLKDKILEDISKNGKIDKVVCKLKMNEENYAIAIVSADTIDYMGDKITFITLTDITELKRNEDKIKYLSLHDNLTDLHNRDYFDKKRLEIDSAKNLPVSVIMGDVNGLKLTNDVFGHSSGDLLLKVIADAFKQSCRSNDIIIRWGGDEFIVLLFKTDYTIANNVKDRVKSTCSNAVIKFGSSNINPSISLGVATKTDVNEDIDEIIKIAENRMYDGKLLESMSMHSSIILSMKTTLYEKSHETEEHATRMSILCNKLAKSLKLPEHELNQLNTFAMLHDIGKIAISEQILLKEGKLTDEEWDEMRKHSEIGFRIAQSAPEISQIAECILTHHERWDGKGYPSNLKANEIPLLSRILSVVDSFDAMTNDRPYRKALSSEEALNELKANASTQFDPDNSEELRDLISFSETAMLIGKKRNKGVIHVYDSQTHEDAIYTKGVINDFNEADIAKEFEMHYQPVVNTKNKSYCKFEALVRWEHPKRGLIYPNSFINVLEKSSQVLELTKVTFIKILKQIEYWETITDKKVIVSVNLSAGCLEEKNYCSQLVDILNESNVDSDQICFEITESKAMEVNEIVKSNLKCIKDNGSTLAIDDFGMEYSSLSKLNVLNCDILKIDMHFTRNIDNPDTKAILEMIKKICINNNMISIIEGVETLDQLKKVEDMGFSHIQGYYFSKPMDTQSTTKYISSQCNE